MFFKWHPKARVALDGDVCHLVMAVHFAFLCNLTVGATRVFTVMWFLLFHLFMWCITLIDLPMCISRGVTAWLPHLYPGHSARQAQDCHHEPRQGELRVVMGPLGGQDWGDWAELTLLNPVKGCGRFCKTSS